MDDQTALSFNGSLPLELNFTHRRGKILKRLSLCHEVDALRTTGPISAGKRIKVAHTLIFIMNQS